MPVDFRCVSDPAGVLDIRINIPPSLSELAFRDLSSAQSTSQVYIQGEVATRWQVQRTKHGSRLKLILQQDGCAEKLPVFLMGEYAENCQQVALGDLVALSDVKIESNTRQQQGELPWQLSVDPADSPMVWVEHRSSDVDRPRTSSPQQQRPRDQQGTSNQQGTSRTSTNRQSCNNLVSELNKPNYHYTMLKDIQVDTTVHVYGIVKYIRPPTPTRGSDKRMMISIIDDSDSEKLKCLFFHRNDKDFPPANTIGDIVRLHRIKISVYRDELQAQAFRGYSCLVFSGDVGGSMTPKSAQKTYTLTQQDLDRVTTLRHFMAGEEDFLSQQVRDPSTPTDVGGCRLEDVQVGQFFSLTCQVVGHCILEPNRNVLLQVWDGTLPSFPLKVEDLMKRDCLDDLIVDEELLAEAAELTVEIQVFDNHAPKAADIRPGAFIRLTNLHAAQYQARNSAEAYCAFLPIELDLHGGGATYNRDIVVLDPSDPDVVQLRSRLVGASGSRAERSRNRSVLQASGSRAERSRNRSVLQASGSRAERSRNRSVLEASGSRAGGSCDRSVLEASGSRAGGSCDRSVLEASGSRTGGPNSSYRVGQAADNPVTLSPERGVSLPKSCDEPKRSITVLTSHHHQPVSDLSRVQHHSVPYKFHVSCRINRYLPHAKSARDLLKLVCKQCNYICPVPTNQKSEPGRPMFQNTDKRNIDRFLCPRCMETSEEQTERVLDYAMMVQLQLQDDFGSVVAGLWQNEAEVFFHQTTAEDILTKPKCFEFVRSRLKSLCPADMEPQSPACQTAPHCEFCIMSYSTNSRTCYQVFDTCVEWSDRDFSRL